MQMFVDNGVAEDDPRMSAVYEHFEGNLRDIVDTLNAKGMHVVLSTVPVNLRQSAPFLSIVRDDLSVRDEARLSAFRERAEAQALNGRWREAQDLWQQAIALDAGHADSHFQLATSLENLGEYALARSHYERALDLDALRFRADTRINGIIERVSREYDPSNVSFVHFQRASPGRAHPTHRAGTCWLSTFTMTFRVTQSSRVFLRVRLRDTSHRQRHQSS